MATNIEIKALGEANMANNNSGDITPAKMREVFGSMLDHLGGNIYLVNSSVTLQTATANTPLLLTNDGAGVLTVTDKRPYYIEPAAFLVGNKLQFSDLKDGTIVNTRIEMELLTSANANVKITAVFRDSVGTEVFRLQFEELFYKSAGTHKKTSNFQFFMDTNITNGTMEIEYQSDTNSSVLWKSIMADIR